MSFFIPSVDPKRSRTPVAQAVVRSPAPPAAAASPEQPLTIAVHPLARSIYSDCLTAIREARVWAETCPDLVNAGSAYLDKAGYAELQRVRDTRVALVNEMERSFYQCVTHLMFGPAVDGTLHIYGETPLSFFWRYDSDYCGGLIYHVNHGKDAAGGPVGTWSLHT